MKLLSTSKDGGKDSTVTAYWLVELKSLFSVALLRFDHGSRDAYHSHAFNSVSWVLKGKLEERHVDGKVEHHGPGLKPVVTRRATFHKVFSHGRTWVFTLRGPWVRYWKERVGSHEHTLTHGRKIVAGNCAQL